MSYHKGKKTGNSKLDLFWLNLVLGSINHKVTLMSQWIHQLQQNKSEQNRNLTRGRLATIVSNNLGTWINGSTPAFLVSFLVFFPLFTFDLGH